MGGSGRDLAQNVTCQGLAGIPKCIETLHKKAKARNGIMDSDDSSGERYKKGRVRMECVIIAFGATRAHIW